MKVIDTMVYFDKSALQKLEAQLADVQKVYMGTVKHSTVQNAIHRLEEKARDANGGYRSIFQSAFKNLEDHVSDVQSSQQNKYRRGNLQRHDRPSSSGHIPASGLVVPLPTSSQPDPLCYSDILGSSLQVFQIRKWRPLTANYKPLTSVTCRSASERPSSSPGTKRSAAPLKTLQKKHSLEASLWYPPWAPREADMPKEDTGLHESLSPQTFSDFMNSHRPFISTLTCGEIRKHTASKGTLTEQSIQGTQVSSDNLSSTSGVDSDGGNSDTRLENLGRDDIETDSTSELEQGNNRLDGLKLQLAVLNLRPEQLESTDTSEMGQEIKCFDFNADNLENPVYEFKCPVPSPLDTIDMYLHAKENSDWRIESSDSGTVDPIVSAMFDRLVEMERLQMETRECEERRVRLMRKRPVSRCNKLRDKRGCSLCLQAACTGGCSNKSPQAPSCEKCYQLLYSGMCRNIKCDQRMRQCGDERRTSVNSPATAQQCYKSGDKQMDTVKSPYRTLLGRPKTALTVVSRGRSISESREQRRPVSATFSGYLSKEVDKLGLEPPRPKHHSNNRLTVPHKTDEQITSKNNNSRVDVITNRRSSSRTKRQAQQHNDLF